MNQAISGDRPARKTTASAGKSVDDYLDSVPKAARAALAKVRKAIKAAAPQATEGISYRILVFKHNGRPLVGLDATSSLPVDPLPHSPPTTLQSSDELRRVLSKQT
jgi:hypothetical protein